MSGSVTVNDLEVDSFGTNYVTVTVVEVRPIPVLSAKNVSRIYFPAIYDLWQYSQR